MKRHSLIASIAMLAAASAPAQGFLQVKTADGDSPVRLERLSVKAAVKGLHAAVDSEFTFRNPNRRILEGELEMTIGDADPVVVGAGECVCIPPNVPHSALALTDLLDVDVFTPPRQDWIDGTDAYLRG